MGTCWEWVSSVQLCRGFPRPALGLKAGTSPQAQVLLQEAHCKEADPLRSYNQDNSETPCLKPELPNQPTSIPSRDSGTPISGPQLPTLTIPVPTCSADTRPQSWDSLGPAAQEMPCGHQDSTHRGCVCSLGLLSQTWGAASEMGLVLELKVGNCGTSRVYSEPKVAGLWSLERRNKSQAVGPPGSSLITCVCL